MSRAASCPRRCSAPSSGGGQRDREGRGVSTDFLQTLFGNNLVDEVNLFVFPLVLGKGKKLFGDGTMPVAMKLAGSRVSGSGVTANRYLAGGEVVTGSFEFEQPTEAELERRRNLT